MPRAPEIRIGKLSYLTGCNIETIRYYERIGLLPSPPRSVARYRLYDVADVRRLVFVRRARELGFPLDEVRRCSRSLPSAMTRPAPRFGGSRPAILPMSERKSLICEHLSAPSLTPCGAAIQESRPIVR
jgi:DNA-binding transcriptional MerR regulator